MQGDGMKRRLLKTLYQSICQWLGLATTVTPEQEDAGAPLLELTDTTTGHDECLEAIHVPYDENLLERARTQWQFGDWKSLAQLNRDALQHHPDRAKLALLAAAGRLQTDQIDDAKKYIRLAKDWGANKNLLARILAAGVHNSLGRAAALDEQHQRALRHFEASIGLGTPGSEASLLTKARTNEQFQQMGLPELGRSATGINRSINTTGFNIDKPTT